MTKAVSNRDIFFLSKQVYYSENTGTFDLYLRRMALLTPHIIKHIISCDKKDFI